MNKLFTKIASLTLGLALAAGAGAFLGSRAAESASATEAVYAEAIFTAANQPENSSYTGTFTNTTNGFSWTVANFNNNKNAWSGVIKCGRKDNASVGTITTAAAVPVKITKASINITAVTSSKVNSIKLFGGASGTTELGSFAVGTGTKEVSIAAGSQSTNQIYKFSFDCASGSSNGLVSINSVKLYYESTAPVGTLTIDPISNRVLAVGDSGTLSYSFEPASGDSATITSATWSSSDSTVVSVSESSYTAEAPGTFKISLSAKDSNGQNYNVSGELCFVSNALSFSTGDDVAIVNLAKDAITTHELTGINKDGSNHYGTAAEYSDDPSGTYRLTVGVGSLAQTYTFSNDGNFISWSSGNSLSSTTSVTDNSSWYVIAYDTYVSILNANDPTRDLLYNNGSTRYACYVGNSSYPRSNIVVLPEPVNPRGVVTITSPTDTLIKLGDSGALSYTWTPNVEAPSATISSIVWTSSDSSVISVDNSLFTYEAIAPGSAKLSYEATDSLGEVYTGKTNEITVVNKVSGDYVKYTSVSLGDTVTLVCDAEEIKTQLAGIVKINSNFVGDYAFYETAPASLYDLTLVEGTAEDSFAFETSDSKYLVWESNNTLNLAEEITANSSWAINFDESGNALISNVADSTRLIKWNNTTPRFSTYTSEQTPIQLYGPSQEIVISENGLAFINNLLSYTCDDSGETAPSVSAWGNLNTQYDATGDDAIPTEDKDLFKGITAVEHASPVTTREKVEQAMAKYDYVVAKYNIGQGLTTKYPDFIDRDPAPLRNISAPTLGTNSSNTAIIVVTVIAVVSVSSIGVLLVLKRRKNHI